jgi:hypothetical protein
MTPAPNTAALWIGFTLVTTGSFHARMGSPGWGREPSPSNRVPLIDGIWSTASGRRHLVDGISMIGGRASEPGSTP